MKLRYYAAMGFMVPALYLADKIPALAANLRRMVRRRPALSPMQSEAADIIVEKLGVPRQEAERIASRRSE